MLDFLLVQRGEKFHGENYIYCMLEMVKEFDSSLSQEHVTIYSFHKLSKLQVNHTNNKKYRNLRNNTRL